MMNWPSHADWDRGNCKNQIQTYSKLTKIFSSLKLRWTIPWLCMNAIAAATSFAQHSTLFLAEVILENAGLFSGFWKNMIHQVFLAQFQYMDHPQSIAFLQQCCPKELDNKGKAKLPTKNIVTPTFIQVRLGSKYPNISAFFNCYLIIPIYLNHLNFYCSQFTLNSSLRSPILSIKFNYIY